MNLQTTGPNGARARLKLHRTHQAEVPNIFYQGVIGQRMQYIFKMTLKSQRLFESTFFLIHVDGGPSNSVAKVGGSPIGSNAHELKSHDIIEVAGVKMEFYLK